MCQCEFINVRKAIFNHHCLICLMDHLCESLLPNISTCMDSELIYILFIQDLLQELPKKTKRSVQLSLKSYEICSIDHSIALTPLKNSEIPLSISNSQTSRGLTPARFCSGDTTRCAFDKY